jgi:hypothetical protein
MCLAQRFLSHSWKHITNSHSTMLSRTACKWAPISVKSSKLRLFNCIFIFANTRNLKIIFYLFGQILQIPAHSMSVLFVVDFQQMKIHILQQSTSLLNLRLNVTCDWPSVLPTSLSVRLLSSWITWHFLNIFITATSSASWAFKILNGISATFKTWLALPFRVLCSAHGVNTRGFFKYLISLRLSFLKFKM